MAVMGPSGEDGYLGGNWNISYRLSIGKPRDGNEGGKGMVDRIDYWMPNWSMTLLALCIVVFYFQWPGRVEGVLFPVLKLENLTGVPDKNVVVITADLNKYRACTYDSLVWRVKGNRIQAVVPDRENVYYEAGDKKKPWGPFLAYMKIDSLSDLEIIVYHNCHGFWLTRTKIWDGKEGVKK